MGPSCQQVAVRHLGKSTDRPLGYLPVCLWALGPLLLQDSRECSNVPLGKAIGQLEGLWGGVKVGAAPTGDSAARLRWGSILAGNGMDHLM